MAEQKLPEGVPSVWSVVRYTIGTFSYYAGVLGIEINKGKSEIYVQLTNGCFLCCKEKGRWILKKDRRAIDLSAPEVKDLTFFDPARTDSSSATGGKDRDLDVRII